jgi:hypothetical protein
MPESTIPVGNPKVSFEKLPCGMLVNTSTDPPRYHPIIFRYSPPPSGDLDSGARRYKSSGHHTAGFDTLEEAMASIQAQPSWQWTGLAWEWNGEGVPAMVEWFLKMDPSTETQTS